MSYLTEHIYDCKRTAVEDTSEVTQIRNAYMYIAKSGEALSIGGKVFEHYIQVFQNGKLYRTLTFRNRTKQQEAAAAYKAMIARGKIYKKPSNAAWG